MSTEFDKRIVRANLLNDGILFFLAAGLVSLVISPFVVVFIVILKLIF